jgi:outer membrane protein TolC
MVVGAALARVSAQGIPVRLTLDQVIARGVQNSLRLAELQARVDAAAAAESGRRVSERPHVALQGGYTRTNHVEEFAVFAPGQPVSVIYPDVPDNYRSRLDLQWPIYTGGRGDALERAARAEREAAGEDLAAARADLRLELTRAFWALVTARETEQVLARAVETMDAHVRELQARQEQGLIPPNDVLSAEAQRSRQRLLAIEARNTRLVSEADLQRLLGLEDAGPIEPVEPAAPAAPPVEEIRALVEEARARRPERRALTDRTDAARFREQAIGAGARPQLNVVAGFDVARPNPRIFPRAGEWNDSWDVSMNLTWSLWDGGRRRAEQAEAAAGVRALEARTGDFDRQVGFEVRQRRLEAESSRAAIAAADDGVRAAVEAQRVVAERFKAGVVTNADVLDAETDALVARLERTRAMANARLAIARLERALGR